MGRTNLYQAGQPEDIGTKPSPGTTPSRLRRPASSGVTRAWFHSPQELCDDTLPLVSYGVRKEDTLLLFGRLCGGAPVSEAASEHFQEGSQHDVAVVTSAPVPGTGSALEPNEPPATDQHAPVNDVQVRDTVKPPMHQILKITRYSRVLLRTICKEVVLNSFITIIKFSKGRCIVTFT